MAQSFKRSAVSKLIKSHQNLYKQITDTLENKQNAENEAYAARKRLLNADYFTHKAELELTTGTVHQDNHRDINKLAAELAFIDKTLWAYDCLQNVKAHYPEIQQIIKKLSPCLNFFRWILASGDDKEQAIKAFHQLEGELTGAYGEDAQYYISWIKETAQTDPESVIANKRLFSELYCACFGNKGGKPIALLTELLSRPQKAHQSLNALRSNFSQKENEIRKAAYAVAEEDAIEKLAVLPTECLSRYLPSMNLKPIVQSGWKTVASVYRANDAQLINVCGINSHTVSKIKQAVKKCFEDLRPYMKLRLSLNNKTPAATKLVCLMRQYCQLLDLQNDIQSIDANIHNVPDSSIKRLNRANNDLQWYFTDDQECTGLIAEYQMLGNCFDCIEKSIAKIRNDLAVTLELKVSEEGWLDFNNRKAQYFSILEKIVPELFGKDNQADKDKNFIFFLTELFERLQKIQKSLAALKNSFTKKEDEIKKAAYAAAEETIIGKLSTLPVEYLSRYKPGMRLKLIASSGFKTVADVYHAKNYQLINVYGVSAYAADEFKQAAKRCFEDLKSGMKLKLNFDHKTPAATNLVCLIYQYRQLMELGNNIQQIDRAIQNNIDPSIKKLRQINNDVQWFSMNDSERNSLIVEYRTLQNYFENIEKAITKINDYWVQITKQATSEQAWLDFRNSPVYYFNVLERIVPELLGNDDGLFGLPDDLAKEIKNQCFFPDGLKCDLRNYQLMGVKYILHQGKVLLGDEMGLGKTIQAIATMVSLRNTGATHFMVVCPASVLHNWHHEITKMSELQSIIVYGTQRKTALRKWERTGGVAVTTYETLSFLTEHIHRGFSMLVVDEAHYVKNPQAKRTINVKKIASWAERLLFMTGTPLENKVEEMTSLIYMLRPQIAKMLYGTPQSQYFRRTIAPVYYRRKKENVLSELPDLIESLEWCTLSAEEAQVYKHALNSKNQAAIRRVSWNVPDLHFSSKGERLLELIEMAQESGRKVLLFSFYLDTINAICNFLGDRCTCPITGSVNPEKRQAIIDMFNESNDKTVLPAQIGAGGTGLNIQEASVVIICEPQLKPSIEKQAIARAYRMGQSRNVLVYRLLCENTIDERITGLLEKKQILFDEYADQSVAAQGTVYDGIPAESFQRLVEEEIQRINRASA